MRSIKHSRFIYLLASAILLTAAQPPFPTGWLAYAALVPFLVGIEGLRGRRAFGYGMLWGLFVNVLGLYWIGVNNTGAFIGAMIYLVLLDGLLTWLLCTIRQNRRALFFPFIWTGFFYMKSIGEMGFPWLSLALTQTYTPAAIQGAAITGAWGLDLWVASVNALIYNGLHKLSKEHIEKKIGSILRIFAPAAGLAIAVLLYGRIVLVVGGADQSEAFTRLQNVNDPRDIPAWIEEGTEPLRIAAIQGSIRPKVKLAPHLLSYNLYLYRRLTRAAVNATDGNLDLVIWPETAIPQFLRRSRQLSQFILALNGEINTPILTGAFGIARVDGKTHHYNAAFMVTERFLNQGTRIYAKRILVPFGERVPYQQVLGFMAGWSMGWSDFSMGVGAPLMGGTPDTPGVPPIGILICYESIFSRLVRPEVMDGAKVLAVITNDAWFGRTSGPYQLTKSAALRAVEFRRPVIRAANSGVSAFVDRWGQIHMSTSLFTKDVIVGRMWPESGLTFFAKTGDWLPLIALFISLAGLFVFREPKRERAVLEQEHK